MRSNKEIRAEAMERIKPVRKKLMIFALVYILISTGISIIPFIGQIGSFLSPFLAIGLMLSIVNVFNGQGENESPVSFFKHFAELFVQTLCTYLWVLLRCIVGVIITFVGMILMVGASVLSTSSSASQLGIVVIIGALIYVVGIIVLIVQMLKYQAIGYEVIHNDRTKPAREIVKEAAQHIEGHKGQWFCMGLYYGLYMFAIYFLIAIVFGILSAVLNDAIITTIGAIVLVIAIIFLVISVLPKMICSCEVLYKEMVGGAPEAAPTEEQPIN